MFPGDVLQRLGSDPGYAGNTDAYDDHRGNGNQTFYESVSLLIHIVRLSPGKSPNSRAWAAVSLRPGLCYLGIV